MTLDPRSVLLVCEPLPEPLRIGECIVRAKITATWIRPGGQSAFVLVGHSEIVYCDEDLEMLRPTIAHDLWNAYERVTTEPPTSGGSGLVLPMIGSDDCDSTTPEGAE